MNKEESLLRARRIENVNSNDAREAGHLFAKPRGANEGGCKGARGARGLRAAAGRRPRAGGQAGWQGGRGLDKRPEPGRERGQERDRGGSTWGAARNGAGRRAGRPARGRRGHGRSR